MGTTASAQETCIKQGKASRLKKLIRETQSSDKDEDVPTIAPSTWAKPWQANFMNYINTFEAPPLPGMSTIQWWGVRSFFLLFVSYSSPLNKINSQRYGPVWFSIARDYLSIMASSVSSERAFSQGGITISKWCNWLKGDVVEALQCVKCAIRHDLLFRKPGPLSVVEEELQVDEFEIEGGLGEKSEDAEKAEDKGWDGLLLDDDGDLDSESNSTDIET